MRRVHKEEIWDPSYPAPLADRPPPGPHPDPRAASTIEGDVLLAARRGRRARGRPPAQASSACTSIAVMFLFSFVNPDHERRAAEIIREEFPDVEHVSLSHEVMARGPEFERVVHHARQRVRRARGSRATSAHLRSSCATAGYAGQLLIMQSTGGVMPPDYVARRAVTLARVGPDRRRDGRDARRGAGRRCADFVAVDMGGTSFDLCLVRGGRPEIKTDWNWRYRYYIGLPDGRRAERRRRRRLDRPGAAGRAARRARSRPAPRPGPVCYGRGGERPTVTDADAVLGYLPADGLRRRAHDARRRRRPRRHRARRRRPARASTSSRRRGASSASSTPTWRTPPAGCSPATAPTPASWRSSPTAATAPVHAWAIAAELGIGPHPGPEGGAGVLRARRARRRLRRRPHARVRRARCPRSTSAGCATLHARASTDEAPQGARADRASAEAQCERRRFRADGLPGPELRHERARARGRRARRDGSARPGRALPRPARGATADSCFRNQQPLVRGVRLIARGPHRKPDRFARARARSPMPPQARKGTPAGVLRRRVRRHAGVRRRPRSAPGAAIDGPGADRGAVHGGRGAARDGCRLAEHLSYELTPIT